MATYTTRSTIILSLLVGALLTPLLPEAAATATTRPSFTTTSKVTAVPAPSFSGETDEIAAPALMLVPLAAAWLETGHLRADRAIRSAVGWEEAAAASRTAAELDASLGRAEEALVELQLASGQRIAGRTELGAAPPLGSIVFIPCLVPSSTPLRSTSVMRSYSSTVVSARGLAPPMPCAGSTAGMVDRDPAS